MSDPYRNVVPVYPDPEKPLTIEEAREELKKAKVALDAANRSWEIAHSRDPQNVGLLTFALVTVLMAIGNVHHWAMTVRQLRVEQKIDQLLDRSDPNPRGGIG